MPRESVSRIANRVRAAGPTRPRKSANRSEARKVLDRPAPPQGWRTTDEDQIALRRWRGRTEIVAIEQLENEHPFFGTFRTQSGTGGSYEVELRSLDAMSNSCGCIDHRVNGLGTCKHIEGVIAALQRRGAKAVRQASREGSGRIEIFLDRRDPPRLTLTRPANGAGMQAAWNWLHPFLSADETLDPDRVEALIEGLPSAPTKIRRLIRVSRHLGPWIERIKRQRSRLQERAAFFAETKTSEVGVDFLRLKLLPYQQEGMLHLAFGERVLLADEMGLGKTVQAIAACELLARRRNIARVLVVCPASLKAEWEEQIARFTDRPTKLVFGPRPQRLAAYSEPPFFTIVNYEQVLTDAEDINAVLAPDVVVLDEAQRIKNWQTKTARRVKSLRSPYAFVLTGTPLENRIDELYSIVQYLDPELVGPLFRFNREFYRLDERGRPTDYQNLAELRRRVGSVMLRRRKADVEKELPGRTVKTYFVPMVEEQLKRYEDYRVPAVRLIYQSQRRPLTQVEFDRLQMLLACMRMICDTPAILDPKCRVSPKLEELERILNDLFEEPDRKVIVFSEWERMLELVRELAAEMGIEAAWHTGSVPQQRRRAEIMRFKKDPMCRLFLSTDSGSVGLNLQVANAVVNLDLPWNPAKLEQRIARAWRKHQTRSVSVVNLVCENSIEHGILHLLGQKQALAQGILDGEGDIAELKMPSGRAAMIERMQAMMQAAEAVAPTIVAADEAVAEDLRHRHGERALFIESRQGSDGRLRVLAVLDLDRDVIAAEAKRVVAARGDGAPLDVEMIDRDTWLAMRRLEATGIIKLAEGTSRVLHQAPELARTDENSGDQAGRVAELLKQAERSLRMAKVLASGGFPEEVSPLIARTIGHAAAAKLAVRGELPADASMATPAQIRALVAGGALPSLALATLAVLGPGTGVPSAAELARLFEQTAQLIAACDQATTSLSQAA
ncbi:MAG TPA: DEAD/DEAH box helicase [Xanthobacteraceae bacterium]|nr:DEAD/DEAH box helicase [Xanthobacteraceae bacterium]